MIVITPVAAMAAAKGAGRLPSIEERRFLREFRWATDEVRRRVKYQGWAVFRQRWELTEAGALVLDRLVTCV